MNENHMKTSVTTGEVSLRWAKKADQRAKSSENGPISPNCYLLGLRRRLDYGPRRQKYHENDGNNHLKTVNTRSNGKSRFTALSPFLPAEASPSKRTPSEVLLIYNSNSPISTAIANYYAAQRGVTNVLAVICQDSALNVTNETMTLADYTSEIETPIRTYLSSHSGINFIVLTKGIPIRIRGAATGSENQGESPQNYGPSLDCYLAALDYSTDNGDVKATIAGSGCQGVAWVNKYYNSTSPFTHAQFGGYLVTRLDGFTQSDAMALVDHSLAATQNPVKGPILLVVDTDFGLGDKTTMPPTTPSTNVTKEESYDHGNADLLHAADILEANGITHDTVISNKPVGIQSNLLGYFSWGSNGSLNDVAYDSTYFAPGALSNTYVSSSMYTFIGQYVDFNGIDLTGMTTMNARVANANGGANSFLIRIDSPSGQIIGTISVPPTGGWQKWTTVTCNLTTTANGVHDVYLTFIPTGVGGSLYNIEWIAFQEGTSGAGTNVIKVSSYKTLSGDAYLETCSEGDKDLGNIPNGQSHMGDLIANGLTGAEGYVGEPTLDGAVGIAFTISHYEAGYNLAESFYAGTPYLGWEGIVVGDPLCAPYFSAHNSIITPIQASSYDGRGGGVSTEGCGEGARDVASISNGSYTTYNVSVPRSAFLTERKCRMV